MTTTLFCSTDASAPELSKTVAGSMYDILKACLINGYGTRTAAGGWTIAFDDAVNHKIALKHPTENIYMRIDDNASLNWCEIRIFTGMTDIDTGTGEFPDPSKLTYAPKISKRYTTGVGDDLWHLLVGDDGNLIQFWTYNASYPAGWFFGKVTMWDDVTQCWMLDASDLNSITSSSFPKQTWTAVAGTGHGFTAKNKWGVDSTEKVNRQIPEESMQNPHPMTGKVMLVKEYIRTVASPYVPVCKYPHRYVSWGDIYNSGFGVHDRIVVGSKKFVVMRYGSIYYFLEYNTDSG
jgi:hypothetical protein